MADLVISSTTDSESDMQAALVHGTEAADDTPTLGEVDRETGEPVAEVVAGAVPAAEVEVPPAKTEETKPVVARPERKDFASDEEFEKAQVGWKANRRIAKLTWEKGEEARRADRLQAQLDAMKRPEAARQEPVAQPVVVEEDDLTKTVETAQASLAGLDQKLKALGTAPKLEDSDTVEGWQSALSEWQEKRADLREERATTKAKIEAFQVLVEERKQGEQQALAEERDQQIAKFAESRREATGRYADFDAVIAANRDMDLSGTMQYVVMTSPIGHDIAYYLATHREEAAELNELGDTPEALRLIGGIERDVRRSLKGREAGTREVVAAPRAITRATEPIAPVGGRATMVDVPLDKMTQQQYNAYMNRREIERRRGRR